MRFLSVPEEKQTDAALDRDMTLQRLMDMYGRDVLRTAMLYLKNRANAEDAFQEVFIKVFNKLETFKNKSSEKTWIITITMNVCRDMLRSSWLKKVLVTDRFNTQGKTGGDPESKIVGRDEKRILFDEVTALSPLYKEVIILYYYQGYDTGEISRILKIREGTVRSRLQRARDLLKTRLGGRIDFE